VSSRRLTFNYHVWDAWVWKVYRMFQQKSIIPKDLWNNQLSVVRAACTRTTTEGCLPLASMAFGSSSAESETSNAGTKSDDVLRIKPPPYQLGHPA